MGEALELTRRAVFGAGAALAGARIAHAQMLIPTARRLTFDIQRGGKSIGRHTVTLRGEPGDMSVAIDVAMTVGLGPIILLKYRHQATETWRGGEFAGLQSRSLTNGKAEWLQAQHSDNGVSIRTAAEAYVAPRAARPLTHWNSASFEGPLFNPQTGVLMRENVSRQTGQSVRVASGQVPATRYVLTGDAELTDWYDAAGDWAALRAKAKDGSIIDYHRLA